MALAAGDKLGPYEILSPIGVGGMGEVYRAQDPRVGREVAIKVSQDRFSERFDREARIIASLNHPNICQLYDVGPNYLVMELIQGESPKGPMSLDDCLRVMRQIADALDYAHEKGVVHRDLKPGNIKLTPEGTVKVLDFGLAKAGSGATAGSGEDSPTLSMAATRAGMILGTAAYMSPEQARGRPIDKRADIWAFGVVFYELLTGQKLFKGEDVTETLASVVKERADLSLVPESVRRLLERCLEKDPKTRLRDIGDVWALLADAPQTSTRAAQAPRLKTGTIAAGVLALVGLALGYIAYRHYSEEPPRVLRYSLLPPDKGALPPTEVPAISPDGRRIAFAVTVSGQPTLWVRDLDAFESRMLAGTEGAALPFWSPDGRFLAFFAHGKLKKVDLVGGPALTLCDSAFVTGGAWGKDDVILFTPTLGGLFRVPAAGGTPVPATTVDSGRELVHSYPQFLPDGRHFLYVALRQDLGEPKVYVGDLGSQSRQEVVGATSNSVYVPPGYLLFARGQTLMAQRFDLGKALLRGDPIPIAQNVNRGATGPGAFSASPTGTLTYAIGGVAAGAQLTWLDRSGKVLGTVSTAGQILMPSISPDGGKVAFTRFDPQTGVPDIWVHELARSADSKFTLGPRFNMFSTWSPDGRFIAYMGTDPDGIHIHRKATSGPGQDEIIDGDTRVKRPLDWSHDGKYIVEDSPGDSKTNGDVWLLRLDEKKPQPYLASEFNEGLAKLSPDGQWIAYYSDESKRPEVYVQTFPTRGGKWQVSINGGSFPIWGKDGKALYFIGLDGRMMAAEVRSIPGKDGATFERGVPKPLFDVHIMAGSSFDVSKDGKFLIPVPVEQPGVAPINVVVNWQEELKK